MACSSKAAICKKALAARLTVIPRKRTRYMEVCCLVAGPGLPAFVATNIWVPCTQIKATCFVRFAAPLPVSKFVVSGACGTFYTATTTGNPATATGKAAATTGNPATTAGKAATTTGNPATTAGKAATATGKAATATGKAATAEGKAATTTGKAATTTGKAATTAANPATTLSLSAPSR